MTGHATGLRASVPLLCDVVGTAIRRHGTTAQPPDRRMAGRQFSRSLT